MSQSLICPFWRSESRGRRDDADRMHQYDLQITYIAVTNPSNREATVELFFYEQDNEGNYRSADWANGRWVLDPKSQGQIRVDPSLEYGDRFFISGWFEIWLSSDDMVIDVSIEWISRSLIYGAASGAGGVAESVGARTVNIFKKRRPLFVRIIERIGFPLGSSLSIPPGITPFDDIDRPFPPGSIRPNPNG